MRKQTSTTSNGDLPLEYVTIVPSNDKAPENLLANAEVEINEETWRYFAGLKLIRFSLWKGDDVAIKVNFPKEKFFVKNEGNKARYLTLLRTVADGDWQATIPLRELVTAAYRAKGGANTARHQASRDPGSEGSIADSSDEPMPDDLDEDAVPF